MRIVCQRDKAVEGVGIAHNAITSVALPILSHLLLSTTDKGIQVIGTNLETTIRSSFEANVEEGGSICLPGSKFYSILRELPSGNFSLTTDNTKSTIKMGDASFTLLGISSEEFPEVPSLSEPTLSLSQATFQDILTKTMFSAGQDEVRQNLNCVLLESSSGEGQEGKTVLRAVATDGRRLSCLTIPHSSVSSPFRALIPLKAARQLVKILGTEDNVDLGMGEGRISFSSSSFSFFSQLVEAKFPDYRGVIPADHQVSFEVETDALASAIKRASLLSDEQTRLVKFKLEEDALVITAASAELGSAQEKLPIRAEGQKVGLEIGFNASFLLEALRVMGKESVEVRLIDQASPGVFCPKSESNYMYILMPVKLRED